jgi:DNA-binding XRE family transcriptional regulator
MSKQYTDYSKKMRARLTPSGKLAIKAFEDSYDLGLSLMQARHARELTQKQLSEIAGINQSEISKIETGSLAINTATLFRLLDALGATVHIELTKPGIVKKSGRSLIKA